jgi:hypothetical protein
MATNCGLAVFVSRDSRSFQDVILRSFVMLRIKSVEEICFYYRSRKADPSPSAQDDTPLI